MNYVSHSQSGSVTFDLTNEQCEHFKKEGFWMSAVGFLPEEKVPSYHCNKCNSDYNEAPRIDVQIRDELGALGDVSFHVGYRCGHCDTIIQVQAFRTAEGIDPRYITFDQTGDFKKPTPADVEAQITKARDSAANGEGNDMKTGEYARFLSQASRWAAKIGYEMHDALAGELAGTYRQGYLKRYSEELPGIVGHMSNMDFAFSLRATEDDFGITPFEGFGLGETFPAFLEALPHVDIPNDPQVRENILHVLANYRRMVGEKSNALKESRRELDRSIDANDEALAEADNAFLSYVMKLHKKHPEARETGS